ncbi:hypothetical protein TRFO_15101 [Tritrichomonas foetus]|uniref:UDENN domain-containing protein n=1 Tax=Tritrichomonas foetus TaxID=1144522 RepID=A0A1J4KXX3_9EUKA|nr:hypothetical protein TRFO_15101 [Tritrichomonas foetus]|eukprot:OHT14548.1 hypothetical protein TRFO_15101 [Tritrichomonas foetus]
MDNAAERTSYLRFYEGDEDNFFENFSVWSIDHEGSQKSLLLNYPQNNNPLTGTSEHIVPSRDALPNLSQPYFHMATLSPEDGIRVIYSIILETKNRITFQLTKESCSIDEKNLIILVIESKFLHPYVFRAILMNLYNHLSATNLNIEDELELYLHPAIDQSILENKLYIAPFDICPAAEIGRFHQFIFSLLKPSQILNILLHLLTGTSIFVTSIDTTQLCVGCFSLLSLLYPIKWPNLFISTLPKNYVETANSPFPFIIGVPFKLLMHKEMKGISIDNLVNLDFGTLITSPNPKIGQKMIVLIQKVSDMISEELTFYKNCCAFPAYRIQLLLWEFIHGVLLISAKMADVNLNDSDLKTNLAKTLLDSKISKYHKKDSVEQYIYESDVVGMFSDHIIRGFEKYIPDDFFSVLNSKGMRDLMIFMQQQKFKK